MRHAGRDVVQEELAIEDDIVPGKERLDPRINGDARFLP
jgi:hypothetical protein